MRFLRRDAVVADLPRTVEIYNFAVATRESSCDLEPTTGPDGKPAQRRVVRTKPNMHYEAGDRTGRLPEVIDLDFAKFVAAYAQGQPPAPAAPAAPSPSPAPAASTQSQSSQPPAKSRTAGTTRQP